MRTIIKVDIRTCRMHTRVGVLYMESRDIALGWGYWKRGTEHSKVMCTGRETQDNTGNIGNTGSEHRDMHRLGKGQGTQEYYNIDNRKGLGLGNNRVRVWN